MHSTVNEAKYIHKWFPGIVTESTYKRRQTITLVYPLLKGPPYFPSPFMLSLNLILCLNECLFSVSLSFSPHLSLSSLPSFLLAHAPPLFMWQRNSCLVRGVRLARQAGCRLCRARTLSSLSHAHTHTRTQSQSHTHLFHALKPHGHIHSHSFKSKTGRSKQLNPH